MLNEEALGDKKNVAAIAALQQKTKDRVSLVKISPLDPDFILILIFAFVCDAIIAIFSLLDFFGLPWLIRLIIQIIPFVVIFLWHLMRAGKIERAKNEGEEQIRKFKGRIEKQKELLSQRKKMQEAIKKESGKTLKKTGKKGAEQIGKKATEKTAKKIIIKKSYTAAGKVAAKKGFLAFFANLAPLLTIIVWANVIWVLSTLKEN